MPYTMTFYHLLPLLRMGGSLHRWWIAVMLCWTMVVVAPCASFLIINPARVTSTPRAHPSTNNHHDSRHTQKESFWRNADKIAALSDPPPPDLLPYLQDKPHRGMFEPASTTPIQCYPLKIVQGRIPHDLVGSVFGNGPGRIRVGHVQYGHWFDGDGYVTRISLDGRFNQATFQAAYVPTDRFLQQQQQQQQQTTNENPLQSLASSGAWTKRGQGKWWQNILAIPTDPSNTSIWCLPALSTKPGQKDNVGVRIFSCSEGGYPLELDPITLQRVTDSTVKELLHKLNNSFFSAHWSQCSQTGDIYNHGYVLQPGPGTKYINTMRLSSQGDLLDQKAHPLPYNTFVHDSCLSQNYLVFIICPWLSPESSLWKYLIGMSAFGKLFEWDTSQSPYLYVIRKSDLSLAYQIPLPLMSTYHMVDAYETNDSTLQVRVSELVNADRERLEDGYFADMYRSHHSPPLLTRLQDYTFDLSSSGSLVSRTEVAPDSALCEFPVVHTMDPQRRARYIWTNCLSHPTVDYMNAWQKMDTQTDALTRSSPTRMFAMNDPNAYLSSACFIPKRGATAEDEGYLVGFCYQALHHTSQVVIVDAATMELCTVLALEQHVPTPFHSTFWPDFLVGIDAETR
jgi:all-trans-8'-apo-beta-carotenal 15,15'-oxygenase